MSTPTAPRPLGPTPASPLAPPPGARPGERVVLFDGVCNLCGGWARFVLAHDRRARLRLATLQSEAGQRLLAWFALPTAIYDTVVFVENGRASVKSTAVLRMFRHLPWPWSWLVVGFVLPRSPRDRLYDFVARHRYRWFGRRETCLLPTPETRTRFLEDRETGSQHGP